MRLIVLVLAILALSSFAFASMALPTEYCLDRNIYADDANIDQIRGCISASYPRSESTCLSLPSQYSDLRDTCLSRGLYCSSIIDPALKSVCDERLESRNNQETMGMFGFILYLLVPVFALGVLLLVGMDLFKRKLSLKRIIVYLVILAVLFLFWLFLVSSFCFPPCMIFY